jgi:hypothetical protein
LARLLEIRVAAPSAIVVFRINSDESLISLPSLTGQFVISSH